MTATARAAFLPFDHLAAELLAFPLGSEAALANPVVALDPAMNDPATVELWEAAERALLSASPALSLDELVSMRDDLWFGLRARSDAARPAGAAGRPRPLQQLLADAATPDPGLTGPQRRRARMWLTFALPADLLAACSGLDPGDELIPPVRDLLERGFAETHLHVGASLDFSTVWAMLCARAATDRLRADSFEAPAAPLGGGRDYPAWLVRAAVARLALAWFLVGADRDGGRLGPRRDFLTFLHGTFRDAVRRRAGAASFSLVLAALADLRLGRLSEIPLTELRGVYADLVDAADPRAAGPAAQRIDPIGVVLGPGPGAPEDRYVAGMCRYLDGLPAGAAAGTAAALFWQTIRVRTLVYRYLTQRPLTPGLPWFLRFYGRMSKARGEAPPPVLVAAALRTSGVAEGLSSLEIRTSPDPNLADLRSWVRAIVGARPDGDRRQVDIGIVFHLLKERGRGGEVRPGVPRAQWAGTHADPAAPINNATCRFAGYYARQRLATTTLAGLLHGWPRTLHVVRGVDVCADELAIPAWVLRPLLADIRRAAEQGRAFLRARGLPVPPPLRTTIHAGEDFAHLLTGLRQVHEALDVLQMQEGDRIGHGVALGIDPVTWSSRVGRVTMPLQERVLDLCWEWNWWTGRGSDGNADRIAYLARTVADGATAWFGHPVGVRQVEQLRTDLTDPDRLAAVGFPDREPTAPAPAGTRMWLLDSYLRDDVAFARGMRTVQIDPEPECAAVERMVMAVRDEVARRGVAIEINPTSNLLIGDLTDLRNHPLWRLAPPRPRADLPPLSVTVGSDDPLVFNCRLPREYQLLYDALMLAGLTDPEAMGWLDRIRRNGMERRFTAAAASGDVFEPANLDPLDAVSP